MSSRRPIRYRTGAAKRAHPRLGRYPYPIHLRARPRKRGGSRVIPILLTLGLAFVVFAGGTAGVLGVTAVGAVTTLSEDLPDPAALGDLTFSQPTVVYDKAGEVELGRFQQELRWVVGYDEIPKLVLDATTTAEDRSFWENEGYDPVAILQAIGENVSGESDRGASTITQQLVRARLLPEQYVQPGSDRYLRKAKELLQANRLTEAFPGEKGKQDIITAYLNEIFYGHDAYGIAAAARVYFGVKDLADLTPAQAALLAALPKSPTTMDPYRFARANAEGQLVVDPKSPPVVRRNYILSNLATSRWTKMTRSQLRRAMAEPVILSGEEPLVFRAPHFTWQVRRKLVEILGSDEAVETGGYRVITSLDWKAQQLAERWITAAVVVPNLPNDQGNQILTDLQIPESDRRWIRELRRKDLHNAALVAIDYKTGQVMAYVGSAGYYRDDLASEKMEPKYDAAGDAERQPGSAWKPIVYATGFEHGIITPATLLLDIATTMGKGDDGKPWIPRDADRLDRGPVLVRQALQYSLNVPAIRAIERIGNVRIAERAEAMGIRFAGGKLLYEQSGLAGAIGTVEVRPLDLTGAYGTLANGGQYLPPQMIVQILDSKGNVVWEPPKTEPVQAISPQAAFLTTDILAGNTDPRQNPIWAEKTMISNGPGGSRRPAAVKTGTANDARDLATYGYLPQPRTKGVPGLAVGIWMGNSGGQKHNPKPPPGVDAATSLTAAAPLWRAFVRDMSNDWPVEQFRMPDGVVTARADAWSGGAPGPWTTRTVSEYFIEGTQPGSGGSPDQPGLLYSIGCGTWRVDPLKAELGPREWDRDVADWIRRASQGTGVTGALDTTTAYFWGESTWGGSLIGNCRPFGGGNGNGNGNGNGRGNGNGNGNDGNGNGD